VLHAGVCPPHGRAGVADPATLAFRYYVKLDPAEIPKAMWAETSPDGSLIWTSSGDDLLAYRSSDVSQANRAPSGPLLEPVRRLAGAVPPTGVTGAVFRDGRLLLAGEANGVYQVWAVDPASGERRLELQMSICGESEGLDVIDTLGGELQWLIGPFDPGCSLSFGPTSALLHFVPAPAHRRFEAEVTDSSVGALPGEVRATFRHPRRQAAAPGTVSLPAERRALTRRILTVSTTSSCRGASPLAEGPELRRVGRATGVASQRCAPVRRRRQYVAHYKNEPA
jgi:hypothetical protein